MENNQTSVDSAPILAFISAKLLNGQTVTTDESLLLSGLLDSMSVIRLVLFLEEQFEMTIPPGDVIITNMASVDTIVAYLSKVPSQS